MKIFECEVERTDKYIIEIDETKFNKEEMEHFKKYFADFDTYEEHAEHIAQFRAKFGERYMDGYGHVLVDGETPLFCSNDQVNTAINIKVVSEEDECSVWVREIENEEETD